MENQEGGTRTSCRIEDRSTSDVVARIRTLDGRDEWVYCHTSVLVAKSKYFADRLSEDWPTCQILDARNCVEVYCQEQDFDYHISLLRLLYVFVSSNGLTAETLHNVKNALGILRAALDLQCPEIASSCVEYLEAVPWEEGEEEEILRIIPSLGSVAAPILSRLQPVDQGAVERVFLSAMRFATSLPPPHLNDLKSSVQEQLEYMLTEDDDAPVLDTASDKIKIKISEFAVKLLSNLSSLLKSLPAEQISPSLEAGKIHLLQVYLSDIPWACQILNKFDMMRDLVVPWTDMSTTLVKIVSRVKSEGDMLEIKLKVIEVTSKVLEAIAYGTVILPPVQRMHMVKVWLPFVRISRPVIESACNNCSGNSSEDEGVSLKVDVELWQSLESAFVSIIVALPSNVQAEILTEWLGDRYVGYPDLTEVFEVWCYRSKVANKRLKMASTDASSVV